MVGHAKATTKTTDMTGVQPSVSAASQASDDAVSTGALTAQHLRAGWRKVYSVEEQRFYYRNVVTGHRQLELPVIDPLPAPEQLEIHAPSDLTGDELAATLDEATQATATGAVSTTKPGNADLWTPNSNAGAPQAHPDLAVKRKGAVKRFFPRDPDEEENERDADRFHLEDEEADCEQRVKTLLEKILVKLVVNKIEELSSKDRVPCEGCEVDSPSQWDHECVWITTEHVLEEFASDYYVTAVQLVLPHAVIELFDAASEKLGREKFMCHDLNAKVRLFMEDIMMYLMADSRNILKLYAQKDQHLDFTIALEQCLFDL